MAVAFLPSTQTYERFPEVLDLESLRLGGFFDDPDQRACTSPDNPIHLAHGSVNVNGDMVKYTGAIPEVILDDAVELKVRGFIGLKRSYRDERNATGTAGTASFTYEIGGKHHGNKIKDIVDSEEHHLRIIEAIIKDLPANRALTHETPNGNNLDFRRIRLSPHSMGGESATRLAAKHPATVESMVMRATIGFGAPRVDKTEPADVIRTAQQVVSYLSSGAIERSPKRLVEVCEFILLHPTRPIGEIISCLTADLLPFFEKTEGLTDKTAYLGYEEDGLVQPRLAERRAKQAVNIFKILAGSGHLEPQDNPVRSAAATAYLHAKLRAA